MALCDFKFPTFWYKIDVACFEVNTGSTWETFFELALC